MVDVGKFACCPAVLFELRTFSFLVQMSCASSQKVEVLDISMSYFFCLFFLFTSCKPEPVRRRVGRVLDEHMK